MDGFTALISVSDARQAVLSAARATNAVTLPLGEALDHVLAEPVACDVDFPPFDRATMDGYAVRSADAASSGVTLKLVGQIAAGDGSTKTVGPGEAMQINTGAPLPAGADAVIQVEKTKKSADGKQVQLAEPVRRGRNITPRSQFIGRGRQVLAAGARLTPSEIAVAATCGASTVTVHRRPTVAFCSTGNELVDITEMPTAAAIRDSNRPLLNACIIRVGGMPRDLGRSVDDRDALSAKVNQGLDDDILCLTGGVSMGEFDYVPEILADAGVELLVRKVAVKPGKPIIIGRTQRGGMVFGLPGNPVSAFVCFHLFVAPAIRAMRGFSRQSAAPHTIKATSTGQVPLTQDRQSYWPATLAINESGRFDATPLNWKGSGDPFGTAGATALIERPPSAAAVEPGDEIDVILLCEL